MPGASYRDLLVWQKAIQLVLECYAITESLPATERYGLSAQIRRAAVSIASNIAEGHRRGSPGMFIQFLSIAKGSVAEVETQLEIVTHLGMAVPELLERPLKLCDEISRMASALQRANRQRRGI